MLQVCCVCRLVHDDSFGNPSFPTLMEHIAQDSRTRHPASHSSRRTRSAHVRNPSRSSSPTDGSDMDPRRHNSGNKDELTEVSVHVSEAVIRLYALSNLNWYMDEKPVGEVPPGARHRRPGTFATFDASHVAAPIAAMATEFISKIGNQQLPTVVNFCEIAFSDVDFEVRVLSWRA